MKYEDMETARQYMGLRFDELYKKLDEGIISPEEAVAEMTAAGVLVDAAVRIAGEASGLVF